MAAWQFGLAIVPRRAWEASPKPEMPIWDGTAALWAGERAAEWRVRLIAALGEPAQYWNDEGLMWGSYESHCFELTDADDGCIDGLTLRIDLRAPGSVLVERLLAFARDHALLLLDGKGRPIEPDPAVVSEAARASRAAELVRDYPSFLARR